MEKEGRGRRYETDDDLIRAIRERGDREAFAALVARHRTWVLRLAQSVVGDRGVGGRADAEDVTQMAFTRVWNGLGAYVSSGQFIPYLRRITVNLARNTLRDRAVEMAREAALVAAGKREPSPVAGFAAGVGGDPSALLESALTAAALRREIRDALVALPEDQRTVAVLHYFAGHTVTQIAAALGCPEGTVKSRLFHARRGLRIRLASSSNLSVSTERNTTRS